MDNTLNCSIFFINECGIFSISKPISLINILVVTPICYIIIVGGKHEQK